MNITTLQECLKRSDEGILKDFFPTAHGIFSKLLHSREYKLAVNDWISFIDNNPSKNTLFELENIARVFRGVDRSKLQRVINGLVKNKQLNKKYQVLA